MRIFAACALAYGGAMVFGLREGYWAIITAVVVMQPDLGDTLQAGRNRILGTLIGAAAGLAVLETDKFGLSAACMFWVALAPLALLTAARPNLRLCCITLVIVVLVPSTSDGLARSIGRVGEILLGTCASILVAAMEAAIRTYRKA